MHTATSAPAPAGPAFARALASIRRALDVARPGLVRRVDEPAELADAPADEVECTCGSGSCAAANWWTECRCTCGGHGHGAARRAADAAYFAARRAAFGISDVPRPRSADPFAGLPVVDDDPFALAAS